MKQLAAMWRPKSEESQSHSLTLSEIIAKWVGPWPEYEGEHRIALTDIWHGSRLPRQPSATKWCLTMEQLPVWTGFNTTIVAETPSFVQNRLTEVKPSRHPSTTAPNNAKSKRTTWLWSWPQVASRGTAVFGASELALFFSPWGCCLVKN